MKKLAIVALAVGILCLVASANSFAQRGISWRGGGGWGAGSTYSRLYDPNTVVTMTGEITRIDKITPLKGMSYGVHFVLKTKDETLSVHLGPAWYIENQEVRIERGDKVEVLGSRITFDGKPAIIAAEVKRGNAVLVLRDKEGFPMWSGWRRR